MDDAKTSGTRIHVAAPEVAPAEPADNRWQNEAHADDEGAVPAVLPPHDFILAQVAHIGNAGLATGLNKHPDDVGPQQAEVRIVRVEGSVGVAVVRAVATGPPLYRTLNSASASDREEILERL